MARPRLMRFVGPGVRFAVVLLAGLLAARFFFSTVMQRGFDPAAVFALLVLTAAAALLWRAALDVRKALRRLRT
jgi:hypothetical protein